MTIAHTRDERAPTPAPASHAASGPQSAAPASRGSVQLKAALRHHDYVTQVQMLAPGEGAGAGSDDVHAAASRGLSGAGGELPYAEQIQRSFGRYDVGGVRAHTDGAAAQASAAIGARAYACGDQIALGQGGKDLHTVAHEAAHVVQQRHGVSLAGGVGQAGDPWERHADAVADLVVQGKSAEGLLAEMAPEPTSGRASSGAGAAVQRAVATDSGVFDDELYEPIVNKGRSVGLSVKLSFTPGHKVDATKIAMMQTATSVDAGVPVDINRLYPTLRVPGGPGAGAVIDQLNGAANPIYGAEAPLTRKLSDTAMSSAPEGAEPSVGYGDSDNTIYRLGYRRRDGYFWATQSAQIVDRPQLPRRGANAGQEFETTAVAIEGEQKGTYYGSVKWGWRTDKDGVFEALPVSLASPGNPSKGFQRAASRWDATRFLPAITTPDEFNFAELTEPLDARNGSRHMKLERRQRIYVPEDATVRGSEMMVLLDEGGVQLVDGGNYWGTWIDPALVVDGLLAEETSVEIDGARCVIMVGSEMELTPTWSADGKRRFAFMGRGAVLNLALDHRAIWLPIVDVKGGETMDLPPAGSR